MEQETIERLVPLAKHIAGKYYSYPIDALGQAYLGLMIAARRCKDEKTFPAFAGMRMEGEVKEERRRYLQRKEREPWSIDQLENMDGWGRLATPQEDSRLEAVRWELEKLAAAAKGRRREIIPRLLGETDREIAESVGVTPLRVWQVRQEVVGRLRRRLR